MACLNKCPEGYYGHQGRCIKLREGCENGQIKSREYFGRVDESTINSDAYEAYTRNGTEISNDPATEIFSIRDELWVESTNESLPVIFTTPESVCVDCR